MKAPHPFEPRVTRGALTDICAICGVNIRRHGLDPDPTPGGAVVVEDSNPCYDGVCISCGLAEQPDPPPCLMGEACTRPTVAGELVGGSCPDCGHTTLVHPGTSNPALQACVICTLLSCE